MPEQAKHRLLRLLRFKIKSQEHTESPIVFPGENGESISGKLFASGALRSASCFFFFLKMPAVSLWSAR